MHLFVLDNGFVKFYGMKRKAQSPQALRLFTKEVDVPNDFIIYPSGGKMSAVVRSFLSLDLFDIVYP